MDNIEIFRLAPSAFTGDHSVMNWNDRIEEGTYVHRVNISPVGTEAMAVGGAPLPGLGFGTYGMPGPRLQEVLVAALRQGFGRIEQLERIADNASIFDFELSQEDMQAIAMLRGPGSRIVHPSHLALAWD